MIPFFFFNDTATTEIYTLSLHDALPISLLTVGSSSRDGRQVPGRVRFELLLAGRAAEVIGLTLMFGDEACGGDVDQHVAHGIDRIDRSGGRGPLVVSTGG